MELTITPDTSIAERFRQIAFAFGHVEALVSPRARHTYAELDRWSDAIAADIVASDTPASQPVAIITRDSLRLVAASLGAVKAGRYFMTVDAGDPEERTASLMAFAEAGLRLVDADLLGAHVIPTIAIREIPFEPVAPVQEAPNSFVQLIFTSGTTGKPKAVALRQRSFVERYIETSSVNGRGAGERVSYTALPGVARAVGEIFGSILNGATLCAFDTRHESLEALAAMIRRERLTTLSLPPALFRRFLTALPSDADLTSVRKLRLGADVVTLADVAAWRAYFPRTTTLERAFASTETGWVLHVSIDHDTPLPGPLVPIGRPRPGVEVRLVDDDGNDVPDGENGELIVRSRSVAHGYWKSPELTAGKFLFDPERPDEPAFRTGDLLRRDANGLYYFIGRADWRIRIRSRRIDPFEVESALVARAAVREAAVVGKSDGDGETRLVAYVVPQDGKAVVPRELSTALRDALPPWMIPSRFYAIDALPTLRSNKVDRAALMRRDDPVDASAGAESADPLEQTLLAIWSDVLAMPVGVDDHFFDDLGGSSLDAAQLVSRVKTATGRALPLSLLIELDTVAKMAAHLRGRPTIDGTLITIEKGGSLPPLFCVSGKGGSVIVFRRLSALLGSEQPFYGLSHHGFAPGAFPTMLKEIAVAYTEVIRERQPEGPYFVAGYSAGGFVAFEIARLLEEAGQRVAFVGLIDTAAVRKPAPVWKRRMKYLHLLREQPVRNSVRITRGLWRRLKKIARLPEDTTGSTPELDTMRKLFSALSREEVGHYGGRVTLFRARHGLGLESALPDMGWGPLCRELEIIDVRGEHDSILSEFAADLADAFRRSLAAARSRYVQ